MSQSARESHALRAEGLRRGWIVVASAVVYVVLVMNVAGVVLVVMLRLSVATVTPLTWSRYAYYYAGEGGWSQRLWQSFVVGSVVGALPFVMLAWPRRRELHGQARFATQRAVVRAGLLGEHGVILERWGRRCLMLPGQQGVALAAPPRSGKGVGIVIPNALNWAGSLVCIDIKRENWMATAGYRQQCGQACFLFDPFNDEGRSACWNPFFYVSEDANRRVNDLQRIAEMLYPDPPNVDPFWTASARSLFLGIALYLFETPTLPRTIGEVLRQGMASDDEGFGGALEAQRRRAQQRTISIVAAMCAGTV